MLLLSCTWTIIYVLFIYWHVYRRYWREEFWLLSLYSYQHFYYYLECYHFGMILNLTLMLKVLKGISAGVVGILIAAFYNPIWASTIKSELDFVLASSLFVFLVYYKLPSWSIVLIGIIIGIMFY